MSGISLDDLRKYALHIGKDYGACFVDWMDWVMEIFDVSHYKIGDFEKNFSQRSAENPLFTALLLTWLEANTTAQREGKLIDWFGTQYEMQMKSKSKADALGQFYTPMSLCYLVARMSVEKITNPDTATVDDCACGSGRLLIAAEQELRKKYGYSPRRYYTAADIDYMSVRMCALNLMIAGVRGRVTCGNTLTDEMGYGYEINEVRAPIPVPFYSIRKITITK